MNTSIKVVKWLERFTATIFQSSGRYSRWFILGVVAVLSCVWTVGCSSPPKTHPQPSKEEIKSDADRFFEKLDREKQGKPEAQRY